jgi:hypothetical protein
MGDSNKLGDDTKCLKSTTIFLVDLLGIITIKVYVISSRRQVLLTVGCMKIRKHVRSQYMVNFFNVPHQWRNIWWQIKYQTLCVESDKGLNKEVLNLPTTESILRVLKGSLFHSDTKWNLPD